MRMRSIEAIFLTIIIIGAINWGLVGFFQFDLIARLFGGMSSIISRALYAIVGIAGIYCLTLYGRMAYVDQDDR
ncbi:DUF378 domain-containing protein [Anaeropeptidivorans aminofermentans]|jgi:hypothetical protein|uniref:DUF378 domain-containing protein n=1 Tax=Anaeropeptidivorans aminofermentans TaxID=2934315 RepID=UPI002ED3A919